MMAKTIGDLLDPAQGWLGTKPTTTIYKYMMIDDQIEEVREVVVHTFTVNEVGDPDLYAAEPIIEWQCSEQGQWVMQHAVETPTWWRVHDWQLSGYKFQIRAKLTGPRLTEWLLKEGKSWR